MEFELRVPFKQVLLFPLSTLRILIRSKLVHSTNILCYCHGNRVFSKSTHYCISFSSHNAPCYFPALNNVHVLLVCGHYDPLSATYCHRRAPQSGLLSRTSSSFISVCPTFLLSSSRDCLQRDYHSRGDHYLSDHYGCRLYQLAAASLTARHLPLHYHHHHCHHHHHRFRRHQLMIRILLISFGSSESFKIFPSTQQKVSLLQV